MQEVIYLGPQISMKLGTSNDVSTKDTYLKYFCVRLKVAMESAIFKIP